MKRILFARYSVAAFVALLGGSLVYPAPAGAQGEPPPPPPPPEIGAPPDPDAPGTPPPPDTAQTPPPAGGGGRYLLLPDISLNGIFNGHGSTDRRDGERDRL